MIEKIDEKQSEYEKGFMKIKLDSDDYLPLGKILKLHNLTIAVRSAFKNTYKYYLQVFLDEYLYEL